MSDTPRTDIEIRQVENLFDSPESIDCKLAIKLAIVEFAKGLERELADKDRQLAEAGARIDFLDHTIDSMNNELAELCPEGQTVIELLAQKDKLIERMKNCQNCGRTGGFCKHCRYAPDKRGWDDNWKEPI